MRTYVVVGIAAAVALCGCDRGRANRQEATASAPAPADNADSAVTMVGCLVPANTTKQSTDARTTNSPPPPTFTLVDVAIPARGSAPGVSGTSGTAGRAPVETGPRSYELVAEKDRLADLQRFANSRVEVSGSIVTSSDVRRMRVTDVRRLAATCAAPKQQ